jgi:hypothetical protein
MKARESIVGAVNDLKKELEDYGARVTDPA